MRRSLVVMCVFIVGVTAFGQVPRGTRGKAAAVLVDSYECPKCSQHFDWNQEDPPTVCPKCQTKLNAVKQDNGTYNLTYNEVSENKWKKPLIYGGIGLGVLGLIGVILKYTVFAAPPPKKKKKKRPADDDEDERPRKKKPRVVDEDERPRKKKPRVVEDDE